MIDSRIPILTYHSIDNSGSVISTSPAKFRRHMELLKEAGFRTVSLKEIINHIRNGKSFPGKSFAITFDDGFKNVYHEAFPVLKEYGFTATIFLVAGKCGGKNQWDNHSGNIPILDVLSWDEIVEMSDNGIDFGAHTMSHPELSVLSIEQAAKEIVDSKSIIQEHLKRAVLFFTYPYGLQTEGVKGIVKKEFAGACLDKMGYTTLKSDTYSLHRIEMYYFSRNNLFRWIDTPFFSYYIQWRSILRTFNGGNRG